jgi:hypothetical protein
MSDLTLDETREEIKGSIDRVQRAYCTMLLAREHEAARLREPKAQRRYSPLSEEVTYGRVLDRELDAILARVAAPEPVPPDALREALRGALDALSSVVEQSIEVRHERWMAPESYVLARRALDRLTAALARPQEGNDARAI